MTTTTRRGFLGAILAAAAAPAIIKAGSLMPIYVPKPEILTLWGDGIHDDTAALRALIGGKSVTRAGQLLDPAAGMIFLPTGSYVLSDTLHFTKDTTPLTIVGSHFTGRNMPPEKPMMHFDHGSFSGPSFRGNVLCLDAPFAKRFA